MKAIVQDKYGSAEQLHLRELERPVIGAGEVLVQVRAAGLDRGVWHLMAGLPYLIRVVGYGFRGPKQRTPGMDVAGVVAEVGEGVEGFAVGDEVFGTCEGAFAELARAKADKLCRKPARLSFVEAAAVPVSACTALEAVRDQAGVRAGHKVLVLGASGGVGSYAVQLCKAFGAEVTGVCSTPKVDFVRSLGADVVLDYTCEGLGSGPFDAILDIGGNRSLSELRRVLTPRGTLVIVGGEGGDRWIGGTDRQLRAMLLSGFVSQELTTFINMTPREQLQSLVKLIEAGQLVPTVDRTFPLAETPDAMRYLVAGKARGKVVITVADSE
jgi:NADPH:quinone reductase-like Zn-dependent oxidoreductase